MTAVSALNTSIFGMFLAVILPPARKDRAVAAVVGTGFILSGLFSYLPVITRMSGSLRVIPLTLVIALAAALIRPVEEQEENTSETEAVPAADIGKPVATVSTETSCDSPRHFPVTENPLAGIAALILSSLTAWFTSNLLLSAAAASIAVLIMQIL